MRIDKFIWNVRIYKTRSKATAACKKSRVMINGDPVKPSREIQEGDIFEVRKKAVVYRFKVKKLLKNRVGAKLVENYIEDITPEEELLKLELEKLMPTFKRRKGEGRPTKKERRDLDKLKW